MEHVTRSQILGGHATNYERFAVVKKADECWPWKGHHGKDGYRRSEARVGTRRTHTSGHRIGYLLRHGSIPAGMVLDHLCMNKGCVNPNHLEVVTVHENLIRQRRSGMCRKKLHAMTPDNTYVNKHGHWTCCACAGIEPNNMGAGVGVGRRRTFVPDERTECVNGHEFTEQNTRLRTKANGGFYKACRTCDHDAKRASRARVKAASTN